MLRFGVFCVVCSLICFPALALFAEQGQRIDFLISGHSLTDEPLAAMVSEISVSLKREASWQRQNIIGSPISARTVGHRSDPRDPVSHPWTGYAAGRGRDGQVIDLVRELRVPATIAGKVYTHLVVAERHDSLGPLQWESTVPLLRHFYELAREGSPGVRGYLFTTWADVAGVGSSKADPSGWVRYEKEQLQLWESIVSRINDSLTNEKRTDRLATLPASGALAELVHRATTGKVPGITGDSVSATMDRLFSDNVHQTNLGRYFLACVTYAALTGESPKGAAHPAEVSSEAAASLQDLAWKYISSYYRDKPHGPQHDFLARAEIARGFAVSFWTYCGRPENAVGGGKFFSGTTLDNPLWTTPGVDESKFWYPPLP